MVSTAQLLLAQGWARHLSKSDSAHQTSGVIQAPPGMTLAQAFRILADCSAAGINGFDAGIITPDMLADPKLPAQRIITP